VGKEKGQRHRVRMRKVNVVDKRIVSDSVHNNDKYEVKSSSLPVEHVVDGGAHDVVDALQVVVELLHVVRGVRVQVVSPLALDHAV